MSKKIQCISPINGTVFAERDVSTMDASFAAVTRAKTAGKAWAARSISERVSLVMAGVARLGEMTDETVPELAQMMGRPVRYGGEFGGVNERASLHVHSCLLYTSPSPRD